MFLMRKLLGAKIFKTAKNQKGFTLGEAVGAIALVSAAIYGTVQVFSVAGKNIVKGEVASAFDGLNNSALANMRAAVATVGPGMNEGVCRLIKTDMKSGGVGFIKAALPPSAPNPFEVDIARVFDSTSWTPVTQNCQPEGAYRKCYKPTERNNAVAKNLLARNPIVSVMVTPVALRTESGGTKLAQIPLGGSGAEINARDLAFLVSSEVTYISDQEGSSDPTKPTNTTANKAVQKKALVHSMVWAGEFTCKTNIIDDAGVSRTITMSPSGIGSGSDAHTLFSSQKEKGADVMSLLFTTVSYTEGYVNNKQRAETYVDPGYVFTSACVEREYRCSEDGDNREWAPGIRIEGTAQYNRNNEIIQTNALSARVSLRFGAKNSSNDIGASATFNGPSPSGANQFVFPTSRVGFTALTSAANTQVCPNVCTSGNNYNTGGFEDSLYRAKIEFDLLQKSERFVVSDEKPTGCICCYGKQCGAVGTKISSVCDKQPPEPVDARVPECSAARSSNIKEFDPYKDLVTVNTDDRCLAIENNGGKVKLTMENCNSSLPYVCFSQGDYKIAYNSSGARANGTFEQGRRNCYEMGYVDVDASEVQERLRMQGNEGASQLPPRVGDRLKYNDSAFAGIFLAPTTEREIDRVGRTLTEEGVNKAWVALRTQRGVIHAEAPVVDFTTSPNISYFDSSGRLHFETDPGLSFPTGDQGGTLLVHGRRYYGVVRVNSEQNAAHEVVCYNPATENFFLSEDKITKYADAVKTCRQEGGVFVPPATPLQWVSMLMRVNRISNIFPWPTGGSATGSSPSAAWVAVNNTSFGINRRQINALLDDASHNDVEHAICRDGDKFEVKENNTNCSSYFSPQDMTPAQRLALVREIRKKGLASGKFKIESGSDAPPPSTNTGSGGSTGGTSGDNTGSGGSTSGGTGTGSGSGTQPTGTNTNN